MSSLNNRSEPPHVGDSVEVRGIHGQPARRGTIVQILGGHQHTRYRVRWDEQHESILYPGAGVVTVTPATHKPVSV